MSPNPLDPVILSVYSVVPIIAVIAATTLTLAALVSISNDTRPGSPRIMWALAVVFAPVLGAVLWLTVGRASRPQVVDVSADE